MITDVLYLIVAFYQPTEIIINIDSIFDVSVYNGNDGEIYITAVEKY